METDINLHIVFCTAFIRNGDKFLFAKRSSNDKQAAGTWATPGGKVDNQVEIGIVEETLKREIEEEVGVQVEDELTYLGSDSFIRGSGHHVVALVFLANYKSGVAKPLEDQEEIKWMTMSEIESLVAADSRLSFLLSRLKLLKKYL